MERESSPATPPAELLDPPYDGGHRGCAEASARCLCLPFIGAANVGFAWCCDGCCGCAPRRRHPEWSRTFGAAVAALRSVAHNLVHNVGCMRCLSDHDIPTWLPTMPGGLRVVSRGPGGPEGCPIGGEWTFARSATATAATADAAAPWVVPPRRVCLYFHGGAFALCTPGTHRGVLMRLVTAARSGGNNGNDGATPASESN